MSVFTNALSQTLWTIAPDLRGYGHSPAQKPFTMEQHLQDLEMLLDRLAVEHCLILGWSLGGILALELALRMPERVTGLVLVAISAHPVGNVPAPTAFELVNTLIATSLNGLYPSWQWNRDTFGRRSVLKYLISNHTEETYGFLTDSGIRAVLKTSPYAHQALTAALRQGYDRRRDLFAIQQPCLLLSGANDRHILSQSTQETAQLLPHSKFICYPNVSHLFPWEISERVNRDIQDWMQSVLEQEQQTL